MKKFILISLSLTLLLMGSISFAGDNVHIETEYKETCINGKCKYEEKTISIDIGYPEEKVKIWTLHTYIKKYIVIQITSITTKNRWYYQYYRWAVDTTISITGTIINKGNIKVSDLPFMMDFIDKYGNTIGQDSCHPFLGRAVSKEIGPNNRRDFHTYTRVGRIPKLTQSIRIKIDLNKIPKNKRIEKNKINWVEQ